MESKPCSVEILVENIEQYGKTSIELYRLKAIDKTATVFSGIATKLALILLFVFGMMILNVGVSIWLGDLLGKSYYGFFIVAGFYAITGMIVYLFRKKWLTKPIKNSIISQIEN